ncbi:glutathione-disulfide reductase [Chelatococcus reniformis]|uniref:Glutathione reductase n=1 Tax=Chelatococcus reniformis TaxID=1494448 RepID=A0A916XHZ7_9HYPH|nr:glutathione-disulfide reductase [Chelatococcus reniformis]GGC73101.1 glutathione-disulfide reductase [Chelatococcus reniformis]
MSVHDVDLFVIGGGSGGVRAGRIAASHGAKVMVAEEFRMGGTCVIRGCVPKKLLVYASRFSHEFEDAAGFGWSVPEASFDWATLIRNKDAEIARLERIYRANLERAGAAIVDSRAVIEDPHTVRIVATGERVRARTILVATGGHPSVEPMVPGFEYAISSNEAFHLESLPERVLVVGGGYIGVEFAGVFAGLGSRTILVHRGDHILRGFDDELRVGVETAYERGGVRVLNGSRLERIEKSQDGLAAHISDGSVLAVDAVMIATGRRPNTRSLGLEEAGVVLDRHGAIEVDPFSQSSVASIYAVGDVTNRANLTPVAIREGHAFADTVFGGMPTRVDYSVIPTAVFSTPELGTVGLTEAQAREAYGNLVVFKSSFKPMKATLSGRDERMFMKVLVDGETDRVVGVHILGEAAGEIIQALGIAITMGATKADFDRTMAVHPTAGEELVTMRTPWAEPGVA